MSLIRSRHTDRTPWKALLLAAAGALALPAAMGAVAFGLGHLTGASSAQATDGGALISAAILLMVSPLLGLAAMILVLPLSSAQIRAGLFGWLPAALTGLAVGGLLAFMIGYPVALPFALAVMLILRALLGLLWPLE
jgi:hypothetical protein